MSYSENRTIYRCEHCSKYYSLSKSAANYHEKRCNSNPKNQHACFGCEHLEKAFDDRKVRSLRCTAKNIIMHSNKTKEKVAKNYPYFTLAGELMPYKCEYFKMKIDF